jgi:hypothetical protein
LEQYLWSSYRAYIGQQNQTPFVNRRWLELMGGKTLPAKQKRYRAYIKGLISKDDDELRGILSASRYAVGEKTFIEKVENELRAKHRGNIQEKDVVWPDKYFIEPASIEKAVAEAYGVKKDVLKYHGNAAGEVKGMALELACTFGGMTQRMAGQYYGGISCAAVGQQRRQLHAKMAQDVALRRKFDQLVVKLNL